jgi:hypothetical protein
MSLLREPSSEPTRWEQLTRRPKAVPKARNMARDKDRLFDNKLEADYAEHLEAERQAGRIARWWPKPFKVRLANRCWYEADFLVQLPDGALEIHETKGFMRDDALLKLKFLVQTYPFNLVVITKGKVRGGYVWNEQPFLP